MKSANGLTRYIALFISALGIIILGFSGFLNNFISGALSPIIDLQTAVSERYSTIQNYFSTPRDITQLQQKNAELEAEIARLRGQIIELQQLSEYQVLAALLDFARSNPEYQYTGASVIGRDPSPFLHYIIINRGSDDGIRKGMPVVSQQGLVGRVSHVIPNAARVQLITDAQSKINIKIHPSETEGILTGSVAGDLLLDFIPQEATVNTGDLVLTSGLGGNYPPNILIGQVSGVRKQDFALFQTGSVQPVVDFSRLEIVLVITNFKPVDVTPLQDNTNP